MSRPADPPTTGNKSAEASTKVSPLGRSNSKRTLKKKGSSSQLGDGTTSSASPDSTSTSPSPLAPESSEPRAIESSSGNKTPVGTTGSPNAISSAIQSGRRQKLGAKAKAGAGEEEEAKESVGKVGEVAPSLRKDWSVSPRVMPHYQAAISADPNLTYIPTRIFIVTDVNFLSYQSNVLQGTNAGAQASRLEFVAMSVGRLWNLNTFLLVAGEKLGFGHAQAIYLKTRLARVISIHDLREDDELILCSHIEGPFALLERKESAPFVRLSPRQRLNSAPGDPSTITSNIQAPNTAKSESAPKSRPPSSSVSTATLGSTLSTGSDSPSKTPLVKSPSPPHRDISTGSANSSSDAISASGRKKTRPLIGVSTSSTGNLSNADETSSNGSQSPSELPKKTKTPAGAPPGSPSGFSLGSAMSSSTDSLERLISPSPKGRTGGTRTKKMSKQTSGGSAGSDGTGGNTGSGGRFRVPRLKIAEELEEDLGPAIYSTPITSQLPFEGRRLVRRDSESFLDVMRNEEIKMNALAAIKEHDKSIGVTVDHPVVELHGDTSKARRAFSVEVLYLELKRSRSLPDVWMAGSRRTVWGPISSTPMVGSTSNTSATSTFRDEEAEFSDDDSSSLTSSTNTDLEGKEIDDRDLNPLTMSEEEVLKRMTYEEKQDVANLQVMNNEVQAGTLRALIRRLFWEYQNDDFVQHFLLTYDLFIGHLSLLKTLIMLFRVPMTDSTATAKQAQSSTFIPPGSSNSSPSSSLNPPGTPTMSSRRNLKITALRRGDSGSSDPPLSPRSTPRTESVPPPYSARSMSSEQLSESDSREEGTTPRDSIAAIASGGGGMGASSATLGMKMVIQHRILTTIKQWIELRYDILSLKANRNFFVLFNEFCEFLSNHPFEKHRLTAKTLLQAVKTAKYNRLMMKQQIELSKPPSSKASTMASSSNARAPTKVTDIPPKDWAVYFTLREQSYYGRVRLKEYHMANMGSKDMSKRSPHLSKLINHFNKLSMWVATAIFRCEGFPDPTPRARATVISHFLKIMEELRLMANYSSMMAIYSALSIIPIERLEKTWAHVSSDDKALLKEPARLREANYKVYREKLEVSEPPYIPIQEILIKDLTLIEENPTILDNGWINFSKIFMLGKAYKAIKRSQTTPYTNKYPANVYSFHKLHENMTLEQLYDLSKHVEPSATDLERIARAENEKRDAEKRERKFRELISKFSKKFPSKTDLPSFFSSETTLDTLVTQPEACAIFYVHLEQVCENSSLDYYRVWFNEWKAIPPKQSERLREVGNRIYDTFLSPASDSAISLNNQSARQNVFKAVKVATDAPVSADLFELINSEVKERLKPLLLDFKRSLELK